MKCPNCNSSNIKIIDDCQYKCKCCATVFKDDETSDLRESLFNNNGFKYKSSVSHYKSGEDIYNKCIKGTVIIKKEIGESKISGSGFIIKSPYVITNAHVVMNENDKYFEFVNVEINGCDFVADVIKVGNYNDVDVALLMLRKTPNIIQSLVCGNSDDVKIGQKVYAIGNSLGEGLCITSGIISDKNRQLTDHVFGFMSDVAVNHGSSGGPLFNEKGEVIAICCSGIDGAKGMNFFIPINIIIKFLADYSNIIK